MAIVDDDQNVHVLVRDMLDQMQEFCWSGSYSNGEAALTGIPSSDAHVVLMDIRMPGISGIECARRLKALSVGLKIVTITGYDDPETIKWARECGADQVLVKPFTFGQFQATLTFLIPCQKDETAKRKWNRKGIAARGMRGASLTERESEFMNHLAGGIPYKQIALKMGVGFWRVHKLQRQVFKKLGAASGIDALRRWREIY